MKKFLIITAFLFLIGAPMHGAALAEAVKPPVIPQVPSLPYIQEETQKSGGESVRSYILDVWGASFLNGFLGLVAATSVVFIIVGGTQLHLALGEEEKIKRARSTLTWAIAGLIISILSVALVKIIANLEF